MSSIEWKEKGNDWFKSGEYEKAIECYDQAISMNNQESVYFSNRSNCLLLLGRKEEALRDAENSVELEESNIKGHYLCGKILSELGAEQNNVKLMEKASNRLKKAYSLCRGQNKAELEESIQIALLLNRKNRFYIEEKEFNKELNSKKEEIEVPL